MSRAASKPSVILVHWHAGEAADRLERLRALDLDPSYFGDASAGMSLAALRAHPPALVVIDLARLPSHGREVADAIRASKALRSTPLLFLSDDASRTEAARQRFPDATFSSWSSLAADVPSALASAPKAPVVPPPRSSLNSATPLYKKLSIKPNSTLVLLGAPAGFADALAPPPGVTTGTSARCQAETVVLFLRSIADLRKRFPAAARCVAPKGFLWLAWPKKASGVKTDLTENVIRDEILPLGWVDVKVCAIDQTWSGLGTKRRIS